jgi:hypothetical protein
MPRRTESTTAVVACTGEYNDASWRRQAVGHLRQGRPGMLHHLEELDAEVLDRQPIGFDHLIYREPRK